MLHSAIVILIGIVFVIALGWLWRRWRWDDDEWHALLQGRRSRDLGSKPLAKKRKRATDSSPSAKQRGTQVTGREPKKGQAILGASFGPITECATQCPACSRLVVVLMPGPPIRGKRAQTVGKHCCTHCGSDIFAARTMDERMIVATHCRLAAGQLQFGNPVELHVLEGATIAGYGGARLDVVPLVVGRGADGQPALLAPEDLGLGPS